MSSERDRESNATSLAALLGLTCIILFLAVAFGVAIGCALVHPRPSRGAVTISMLPPGGPAINPGTGSDGLFPLHRMSAAEPVAGRTKSTGNRMTAPTGQPAGTSLGSSGSKATGATESSTPTFVLALPQPQPQDHGPYAMLKGTFKLLVSLHNEGKLPATILNCKTQRRHQASPLAACKS